jgi:hypothetical protein
VDIRAQTAKFSKEVLLAGPDELNQRSLVLPAYPFQVVTDGVIGIDLANGLQCGLLPPDLVQDEKDQAECTADSIAQSQ